jgi:hypothetical protein
MVVLVLQLIALGFFVTGERVVFTVETLWTIGIWEWTTRGGGKGTGSS